MDQLARAAAEDRRDIFSEAAARLGMRPGVIEKDFWVCLTLKLLFERSPFQNGLVFKGGTSLSKVHGLIERFSEDIDLVLDWRLIGYSTGLTEHPSRTRQDRFNKEINRAAAAFIAGTLSPELDRMCRGERSGLSAAVDPDDPHVINVRYPAAFSEGYIRPEVRLGIGPLASWVPSSAHAIRPYACDALPQVFERPSCRVVAIAAERTFSEKAPILHQDAHRQAAIPQRYSRHYYDMHMLARSPMRGSALRQLELLQEVVAFKQRFYPSAWARYDLASPGTLLLLPRDAAQLARLERDYRDMQVMLFGQPPKFGAIIQTLQQLEAEIDSTPESARRAAPTRH